MKHCFANTWIFVGQDSQTSNPGDYFHTEIGKKPIVMVHHLDGGIHVLYNRCTHNGPKLIIDCTSNTGKLFCCPYHAWTYKTDGTRLGMALRKGYDSTGLEKRNLDTDTALVGAVRNYSGFVFAQLAHEGPGFEYFSAITRTPSIT